MIKRVPKQILSVIYFLMFAYQETRSLRFEESQKLLSKSFLHCLLFLNINNNHKSILKSLPQPNFSKLTQSLNNAVDQIALISNIPTVSDGQTIAAQLEQISQRLVRQGEQITTVLTEIIIVRNGVVILRDHVASINTRLNAR